MLLQCINAFKCSINCSLRSLLNAQPVELIIIFDSGDFNKMRRTWISLFSFQSFFVSIASFPSELKFQYNVFQFFRYVSQNDVWHKMYDNAHIVLYILHIKWKFRIWICQIERVECMCSLIKTNCYKICIRKMENSFIIKSVAFFNSTKYSLYIVYERFLHTAPVGRWNVIFIVWDPEMKDIHSIYIYIYCISTS